MNVVEQQFEELRRNPPFENAKLQRLPTGGYLIQVENLPLPAGWSRGKTNLFLVIPAGYPLAAPDSFWTTPVPQGAGQRPIEGFSATLQSFSWHAGVWNPSHDSLLNFGKLVLQRFQTPT
jgi:hypothetical protein